MDSGTFGWIELVLFYGIAIGFGVWQWVKMDRMLKKTRAEKGSERRGRARGRTACRLTQLAFIQDRRGRDVCTPERFADYPM